MAHPALSASAPTIFQFRSTEVRTLVLDGEVWFVASDVAKALGYHEAKDMTRILDEDEAGRHIVPVRSENGVEQNREVTIINESGLYHAVLKSRKPEAKPFRKWVTSEVLPAIRKTGQYASTPTLDVRAAMLDDNSDPIPMPPAIQALIDRKAWDMTHEAYALCQAFLARRVTYRCAYGYPQRYIDHAQARTVIDENSLGMALAPAHFNRLETLLRLSEMLADTTSDHHAKLRDEIKGVLQ